MALKLGLKASQNAIGVDFPEAYHRIVEVNMNFAEECGRIVIYAYANQQARIDGKQPIGTVAVDVQKETQEAIINKDIEGNEVILRPQIPGFNEFISDNAQSFETVRNALYGFVKLFPEFKTAKDV